MTTTLGLITIFLVLIILFQIANANEMLASLKSRDAELEVSERTNRLQGLGFLIFLVVGMIGAFWSAWYYQDFYLPYPSSEHGAWLRSMFQWTLAATLPVFVATHIALFWFAFKYRGEKKRIGYFFPESHKLEFIWTVIPSIVLILLVFEGLRNWYKITGPAPENAIVIEATAKQFQWDFRYSGKDNHLGTKTVKLISGDNAMGQVWTDKHNQDDFLTTELHIPLGEPVLVKINSIDVLHSIYLPHFRVKMDAVPGIPTQFWFTATKSTQQMRDELGDPEFNYELACAELCGQAHYNMRRVVVVEEPAEFKKWFNEQEPTFKILQSEVGQLDDLEDTKGQAYNEELEEEETTTKSTL